MKNKNKKTMKVPARVCPSCLGSGEVPVMGKYTQYTPEIRAEARKLLREGLSLRAIGQKLGIGHPQKVSSMIKANL